MNRFLRWIRTVTGWPRKNAVDPRKRLAAKGEALAARNLRKGGYRIVERGWRWHRYEIDLIAIKENTLVFVEVKTRTSTAFGRPHESVDRDKKKSIRSAAKAYIAHKRLQSLIIRFDIVEVLFENKKPALNHIENAFHGNF